MISSLILTVRALSAEFARRLFIPIFIIVSIALIIVLGLGIWLIQVNVWWWILLIVSIIALFVFLTLSVIFIVVLGIITPSQTAAQSQAVKSFVDKLQDIAETVQTPKAILVGRLVADALRKNENGLVRTMSNHTLTTKKDFDAIRQSFDRRNEQV